MALPDLSYLVQPGAVVAVKATPKASRERIEEGTPLRVYVTAPPDKGKANAAVTKLLAKALGVPKSRLTLIRGDTARDKQFRID
ncbi:MAG: hypothetical protein CSA72_00940 [Rhodobacterales bacterium]|nr:MAG: hypothetical protein CSA72_00940 [Rhodobacterales bacterium]